MNYSKRIYRRKFFNSPNNINQHPTVHQIMLMADSARADTDRKVMGLVKTFHYSRNPKFARDAIEHIQRAELK